MGDRTGNILRITLIMAIFSLIVPGITFSVHADEKETVENNYPVGLGGENLDEIVSVMSSIDLKETFDSVIDFVKDIVLNKLGGSLAEITRLGV